MDRYRPMPELDFLLHHTLRSSAERNEKKEALVHTDLRLTYGELDRQTSGMAQGLRDAGLMGGERVGVFLEPSVPQVVSIYGTCRAGGVFVPIHHGLFPRQIAHIVNDCEMTALIVSADKLDDLQEILGDTPSLRFIVVDGDNSTSIAQTRLDFHTLCTTKPELPWQDRAIENDLAAIIYTSGSTGRPKGVMLSHANLISGASIVSDYLRITQDDRLLAVLPFSFDAGLNQLTTALRQGASLILTSFLFAKDIVKALETERITGLAGVPSLWALLVQPNSKLADTQLPHLRYITNTGGALPQNILADLRKALPETDVVLMYGLTEAFRSTYLPPDELEGRPTSMGKAIPNTEIMVVNHRGERCKPNEIGEVVHYGPTVSMGYWGHPELTNKFFRPHPFPPPGVTQPCKVVYSGDLVRTDEDGFLYFVGRSDNQIKSSGFRVSPTEIEEILHKNASLCEAAVIGIPNSVLGHRIKAFVVAAEGNRVDAEELRAICATAMPRHMVPEVIEVVPSLPKTSSGKVDYPALRRSEEDETVEA